MTFPSRDDYEARERREWERAQLDWRDETARDEFRRTGICPRRIVATDPVRGVCPVCQHAELLHPGFPNPDPELTGCLACRVKSRPS